MSRKGIYDVHCHIVPGVDDGALNYEDTRSCCRWNTIRVCGGLL